MRWPILSADGKIIPMTVINGQIQIDADELGPAVGKLLDLLMEQKLPIQISRDGRPLAEVLPTGALPPVDPQLQVTFNVPPSGLTTADDWRGAGL